MDGLAVPSGFVGIGTDAGLGGRHGLCRVGPCELNLASGPVGGFEARHLAGVRLTRKMPERVVCTLLCASLVIAGLKVTH
jgi:hypothetical protein